MSAVKTALLAAAGGNRAAINMMGGDARLNLGIAPGVAFTDPLARYHSSPASW